MSIPLRPRAIDELQAASAVGQGKLYQVYDELLRERGVPTAQVLLTFFDMSARTHYLNARQTLRKLLDWRVVPVINENDTTTTDEISFGNNDFLAAQVAILLGAELLLLLTDAGGRVHRRPPPQPGRAAGGQRSSEFDALDGARHRPRHLAARLRRHALEGGRRRDGHRGRDPHGDRQRARRRHHPGRGRRGSRSARGSPREKPVIPASSCGSSTPSRRAGSVLVDAGAARALREGGTSLLPVGIVDVAGDFDAGDAVEVAHDGRAVGKGICNYSAAELRQVRGLKSLAVRAVLPRASEEAVHRDYFVLA